MWPILQFPADLVTFTEEVIYGKLLFLVQWEYALFYKQHFHKQDQAKIGQKSSKNKTPRGWTLAIWELFAFFIQVIIQK